MSSELVTFDRFKVAATLGIVGGLLVAVAVPYFTLVYGASLGAGLQATIIILALLLGFILAAVSTFFGIVIPAKVGRLDQLIPKGRIRVEKTPQGRTVEIGGAPESPQDAAAEETS
jgi:hypothetical protein